MMKSTALYQGLSLVSPALNMIHIPKKKSNQLSVMVHHPLSVLLHVTLSQCMNSSGSVKLTRPLFHIHFGAI